MNNLQQSVTLFDHYKSTAEVFHYFGVLAIYGLCRTAMEADDAALKAKCVAELERFPDHITKHSAYNFPSYRIGGIPRAYALYTGMMTDEQTKMQVKLYADEMMLATRDAQGIMSHPYLPLEQRIWIDCAMAITPYLLFAGLALNRPDYIDEGINQALLMYDAFTNKSTGLLHQSRGFNGPMKFSTDYWGRGQGWGIIALTELINYLPTDHVQYETVKTYFVNHCKAMLPHQTKRGMWRQHLVLAEAPGSWEESSGTGLIAYAYGVGVEKGVLGPEFEASFNQAVEALKQYCINADGSTELCCPGCLCPGEGENKGTPQAYVTEKAPVIDDPHSFGPLMLALVQAQRLASVKA
jgi:unsaturated rhamnogalacturonyl hydrolase